MPDLLDRTVVVPLGTATNLGAPSVREATRRSLGCDGRSVVFGLFGNLTRGKMFEEALHAFAIASGRLPTARLLVVGKDWEGGAARSLAAELGLGGRASFLGHVDMATYLRLLTATDVGLCLRRPPTFGETSASLLDVLRSGVPPIVTDVGSFAEYPDAVVRKWDPARDGVAGLAERMVELGADPSLRAARSEAAIEHVRTRHAWPLVVDRYAEVIRRASA